MEFTQFFLSKDEINENIDKLDELLGQEMIISDSNDENHESDNDILEMANQIFVSAINLNDDQLITTISYKYMIFRNYNASIYTQNIKKFKQYLDISIKKKDMKLARSIYKAIHILQLMEGHVDKNIEEYKQYKEQLELNEEEEIKIKEVNIPTGFINKIKHYKDESS